MDKDTAITARRTGRCCSLSGSASPCPPLGRSDAARRMRCRRRAGESRRKGRRQRFYVVNVIGWRQQRIELPGLDDLLTRNGQPRTRFVPSVVEPAVGQPPACRSR